MGASSNKEPAIQSLPPLYSRWLCCRSPGRSVKPMRCSPPSYQSRKLISCNTQALTVAMHGATSAPGGGGSALGAMPVACVVTAAELSLAGGNNIAGLSMSEAMYRKILIATDGSALSEKSLSTGVALAKHLGATITVVHVTEPWATDFTPELTKEPFWVEYDAACATRAATAGDAGVSCTVRHVPNRYPADGILEVADAYGCDLIIMSSHVARFVMGSQAQEVLVRSRPQYSVAGDAARARHCTEGAR